MSKIAEHLAWLLSAYKPNAAGETTGLECKACHKKIGGLEASRSVIKIAAFYEVMRLTPQFIAPLVDLEGPLCEKCFANWESGTAG